MNENHAKLCPSPEWAAYMHSDVLPWFTSQADLGEHMLEIGPGPGAATEWLRHRVRRLTVLEIDSEAGAKLAQAYPDGNVEVVIGDATQAGWPDETFDSVGSFTMLHHVPTLALQNKILAEAYRLLKPGGVLVVSDSLASDDLHHFHVGDTYNPIDPASALSRLQTIGFDKITLAVDWIVKFVARKPGALNRNCEQADRQAQS
jgi:SAM-dependent methyltransferase